MRYVLAFYFQNFPNITVVIEMKSKANVNKLNASRVRTDGKNMFSLIGSEII